MGMRPFVSAELGWSGLRHDIFGLIIVVNRTQNLVFPGLLFTVFNPYVDTCLVRAWLHGIWLVLHRQWHIFPCHWLADKHVWHSRFFGYTTNLYCRCRLLVCLNVTNGSPTIPLLTNSHTDVRDWWPMVIPVKMGVNFPYNLWGSFKWTGHNWPTSDQIWSLPTYLLLVDVRIGWDARSEFLPMIFFFLSFPRDLM